MFEVNGARLTTVSPTPFRSFADYDAMEIHTDTCTCYYELQI